MILYVYSKKWINNTKFSWKGFVAYSLYLLVYEVNIWFIIWITACCAHYRCHHYIVITVFVHHSKSIFNWHTPVAEFSSRLLDSNTSKVCWANVWEMKIFLKNLNTKVFCNWGLSWIYNQLITQNHTQYVFISI